MSKPKAMKKKVLVIQITGTKKDCKVSPGTARVRGGDVIQFDAVNTGATIFLKGALSFEGMGADAEALTVPLGYTLDIKVKPDVLNHPPPGGLKPDGTEAVAGTYPYAVLCTACNDFAEANSTPVIMIEPPPDRGGGGGF
jgi:hypothetical protein